jgi:protein-tyrosine-phosphatase
MPSILFLCAGSYYRSRFAEELFNHRAPGLGLAWSATSRARALAIERIAGTWRSGYLSLVSDKRWK